MQRTSVCSLICIPHCYPQTSELGVTEHVEGDACKFALWVGRTPTSDNKIVLKVRGPPRTREMSLSVRVVVVGCRTQIQPGRLTL